VSLLGLAAPAAVVAAPRFGPRWGGAAWAATPWTARGGGVRVWGARSREGKIASGRRAEREIGDGLAPFFGARAGMDGSMEEETLSHDAQ
jgi:hypothetical protein